MRSLRGWAGALSTGAVAFVFFLGYPAAAGKKEAKADPQAVEVIEKNLAAMGGREALAKIQTRVDSGTITGILQVTVPMWMTDYGFSTSASSASHPMPKAKRSGVKETYQKVPRFYAEMTRINGVLFSSGGTYADVKEGDVGWVSYPGVFSDSHKLDKDKFHDQSIFDPLLRWRQHYRVVEYQGEKTIDGQRCLALRFYPESGGMPFNRYYDATSYLMVADGTTWYKRSYSDFREVSGIKIPFATTIEPNGGRYEIKLDVVVFNQPIADSFFDPRPKK